jgi:UDPglucose--hexose-1-phosphate uridylyltransferase
MSQLTESHRRYNPLLDEWVLCSPHRLDRPWQGQVETIAGERLPEYDPSCYLCPGNTRARGQRNPDYKTTFVFDNDFAALTREAHGTASTDDLLRAEPESGICRVVCFSPRHDLTLALMDAASIRPVIDTWAAEVEALGALPHIQHVQVFENKGAMMGCSNPHPHCQVWASEHVPTNPARRLASQQRYFEKNGRDLLGDYLAKEIAQELAPPEAASRPDGGRVVLRNEHWVVVVPFWAVWPFETMLLPVRHVRDLPSLTPAERDALADVLSRLNKRYDNLFRCSFPYSMGFHGRPTDGGEHPYWRLHATFFPPLLRSATVRKFVVGYELTAETQRDLTPEQAAARLREQSETHYLSKVAESMEASK